MLINLVWSLANKLPSPSPSQPLSCLTMAKLVPKGIEAMDLLTIWPKHMLVKMILGWLPEKTRLCLGGLTDPLWYPSTYKSTNFYVCFSYILNAARGITNTWMKKSSMLGLIFQRFARSWTILKLPKNILCTITNTLRYFASMPNIFRNWTFENLKRSVYWT